MTKYYYIPKSLENLLAQYQQVWLASSYTAYMIVTGVYAEVHPEVVSELYSEVLDQQKKPISWFISDAENELYYELQGFCIEAKPNNMPDDLPHNVLVFDSATKFLNFAKEL